jgi:hypothetical protein
VRSDDLHPGNTYLLSGPRGRLVTVLDTPPDVRGRARVRVLFQNGVKAGDEADIPTRRIIAALTGPAVSAQPREEKTRIVRVQRDPEVGDEVLWTKTGPLVWTVQDVDQAEAVITSVIMQRPTSQSAPLSELEVRPVEVKPSGQPASAARRHEGPLPSEPEHRAPDSSLAPDKPRRELDELLDDVLFSRRCLSQYQRLYAPRLAGPALTERLRGEIRMRGYLLTDRDGPGREYARVRVQGRFDIVLPRRPTPDEPLLVEDLRVPARRKPRVRRSTRGR